MQRDIQCRDSVEAMEKLGRFDKEFVAYGTAIQEADGRIFYYAASDEKKLQKLVQTERWRERYFTPVVSIAKRSVVPSGMEEDIVQAIKYSLLGKMRAAYETVDYFSLMQPFFAKAPNDNAYPLLSAYKAKIEGHFEDRELQLFSGAVKMAYEAKILTTRHFQEFIQWHQYMQRQMDDDPIVADNVERTLYGFVYYTEGGYKIAYDAQELCVIHQSIDKIMNGFLVGPIMQKTYWFQQFKQMQEIREQFCHWLWEGQNESYFNLLMKMKSAPGVIDEKALHTVKACLKDSKMAYDACQYYDYLWNKE